ncbi:XRE family transcriptional regulator [Micromonospora sp. CPCC 206060]|uniref:helix-turn-helix domain-containing protein n=1 Tax=Micromonospora sp. CPCC 206060 TaxID=3122406 RepID=UPI002FF3A3C9
MPEIAAAVRVAISGNLRRKRLANGMSLRELAERTGVSKALLSQIERGVANPTVDILARIADAVDLSFTELTRSPLLGPEVLRSGESEPLMVGETSVRTLFAGAERRRFELSEGLIPADAHSVKSAHGVGSMEHAYVVEGLVTVASNGWSVRLEAGDAIRFAAEAEHVYITADKPARILTLISFDS